MIRGRPTPDKGSPAQRSEALEAAYKSGVLTEAEYHTKLSQISGNPTQTSPRVCAFGSNTCKRYGGAWRTVEEFSDYQSALDSVKNDDFGRYKWAKSSGKPGDRRLVCNMHVDCEHPLRIYEDSTGRWLVQLHTGIAHSGAPKGCRRKNSAMTAQQEDHLRDACNDGAHRIITVSHSYHGICDISYQYRACASTMHVSLP